MAKRKTNPRRTLAVELDRNRLDQVNEWRAILLNSIPKEQRSGFDEPTERALQMVEQLADYTCEEARWALAQLVGAIEDDNTTAAGIALDAHTDIKDMVDQARLEEV